MRRGRAQHEPKPDARRICHRRTRLPMRALGASFPRGFDAGPTIAITELRARARSLQYAAGPNILLPTAVPGFPSEVPVPVHVHPALPLFRKEMCSAASATARCSVGQLKVPELLPRPLLPCQSDGHRTSASLDHGNERGATGYNHPPHCQERSTKMPRPTFRMYRPPLVASGRAISRRPRSLARGARVRVGYTSIRMYLWRESCPSRKSR